MVLEIKSLYYFNLNFFFIILVFKLIDAYRFSTFVNFSVQKDVMCHVASD